MKHLPVVSRRQDSHNFPKKELTELNILLLFGAPMSRFKLWRVKNKSLSRATGDKAARAGALLLLPFEGRGDMRQWPRGLKMFWYTTQGWYYPYYTVHGSRRVLGCVIPNPRCLFIVVYNTIYLLTHLF